MATALPPLTSEPTWNNLLKYFNETGKNINIKQLFDNDADRFNKFR